MSNAIVTSTTTDADAHWFMDHTDRRAHIRKAKPQEYSAEFNSLGPHDMGRRRILLFRGPRNTELAGRIIKIPFLAFADETIEDEDRVLLPLIDQIMREQAKNYRMAN